MIYEKKMKLRGGVGQIRESKEVGGWTKCGKNIWHKPILPSFGQLTYSIVNLMLSFVSKEQKNEILLEKN